MIILIFHPDSACRFILKEWISRATPHSVFAEDSTDLVAAITRHEPDLVLQARFSPEQVLFPAIGFCELPEGAEANLGPDHPINELLSLAEDLSRHIQNADLHPIQIIFPT